MQALKMQRAKVAEQAGRAPAPHEENVLTHWVRSAADMRLQVLSPAACHLRVTSTTTTSLVGTCPLHACLKSGPAATADVAV